MRLSISRSRESIWVWLFWGLGIYLALELGACRIAAQVLNKTAGELAGPYLAFAVPWAILAPLIWWLRKREEQGASSKQLARGWGLGMAVFGVAVSVAVFYSGSVLRLMDPTDVVGGFITTVLLSVPILYFGMYHMALKRLSARTVEKLKPRSDGASSPT
jgi:peptidoglycan biosynthesis protein MviN/MurJ (putative lipid II flippase)